MTLDELASQAGQTPSDLRRWQALGLLPSDATSFDANHAERVRLIVFAMARGYTAEKLADIAEVHGDMIGSFVESFAAERGEPVCSVEELADRVEIDAEVFERLLAAAGLQGERYAYQRDADAVRLLKTALEGGLPVEVLTQILRVFADATGKMADSASRLFHLHVHEQLRAGGSAGAELLHLTNAMSKPLLELVEPAVLYFHRRAWEHALAEDMMLHLAEEATAPSEVPGEFLRAFLFVDLSSFTPMTEAMGDAAAALVVERFSELVRDGAARCSGQVVKQIGDEFMLVSPDGRSAARCGLAIQEQAAAEAQFPALRLGAHVGSVLYREGDYLGTAVNTAARVAAAASRHQFFVTGEVLDQLDDPTVEVVAVGSRALKGLSEEVELFELGGSRAREAKVVDLVCKMEIDDASADVRLDWAGRRLAFCSEGCLRRFAAQPDRYL